MPIIRRSLEFEGHFTQIPNAWLRDQRLSLRAKGLLSQLLSHTDGWSVTISHLADVNGCGRDAIRSAVRELEEAGYLTRSQARAEGGEFAEAVWETTEPMTESPLPEKPSTVNPLHKKTKPKKTNEKKSYALIESQFEQFWETYPRKVGKKAARVAFLRAIKDAKPEDVLRGTQQLAEDPNLPSKEYIPYPATWLNREGWNDEPFPKREDKKSAPPPAYTPGPRDWVRVEHDAGEHWACRPGEFGH